MIPHFLSFFLRMNPQKQWRLFIGLVSAQSHFLVR